MNINMMICKKCPHAKVHRTASTVGGSWYDKENRKCHNYGEAYKDIVNIRCQMSDGYSFVFESWPNTESEDLDWRMLKVQDKAEIPKDKCPYILEHALK